MEFRPGNVVRSKAGHDQNDLLLVMALEGDRVLLADGKLRRPESPKRKNLRHIVLVKASVGELSDRVAAGERVLASEIRKTLSALAESKTE